MKLNRIFSFSALAVLSLGMLVGCEDDSSTENQTSKELVAFADMPRPVDVPQGETVTIQGEVYAGHISNQDRVISLEVITETLSGQTVTTADADEFTVPASVTIPAGSKVGVFQITLTDVDLGYNGKYLVVGLVPQLGIDVIMGTATIPVADGGGFEKINDRLIIDARRRCDYTPFTVEISVDGYGSETTWELYDGDFNVIASGGPYEDGNPGSGELRSLCLEDGNYTFVAYDAYGDGMYDQTNQGFYRLAKYDVDGNETEVANNGTFGDYDTVEFSIP